MNQTVPFDEMFLPQDLERAQYLKERVRIAIDSMKRAFAEGKMVSVQIESGNVGLMIAEMTVLSNARANYERGFKEGVLKSEGISQLVEALKQEGAVMLTILPVGGANLENDYRS